MSKKTKKGTWSILRTSLILLSIGGILIMSYLTKLHFKPEDNAFCNLGEGLSCDVVNKSIYSEVWGIPMSVLGLGYFVATLIIILFFYKKEWLKRLLFISVAFLGPSLYLSLIEFFVIDNICIFCELSKIIILGIIILLILELKKEKPKLNFFVSAIILGLILAGITYLIHSNSMPKDEYNEFAQCLAEKNFLMYGSVTCSFCARQRELFGDSFKFITEIECDPRNPNPETERCIGKQVKRTPTWIQEDANGNVLYRFDPGVVSLKDLSAVSGCQLIQ